MITVALGGTYVGAGYTVPTPITVAPGEIITLYVQGIGAGITAPVASVAYPLRATLAGISVSMTQMLAPMGPIGVPVLSIFPASTCSTAGAANCLSYVGITVQIPYELVSNLGPVPGYITNQAFLTVTENGVSTVIQVSAMYDQIHILRQQDTIFTLGVPATSENFPLVTHADGSLVTPDNLAIVGETLVIYAVGLGFTSPQVATGAQSPSPAATVASAVAFDFNDNAGPGWPFAPGIPVGGGSGYPSAPHRMCLLSRALFPDSQVSIKSISSCLPCRHLMMFCAPRSQTPTLRSAWSVLRVLMALGSVSRFISHKLGMRQREADLLRRTTGRYLVQRTADDSPLGRQSNKDNSRGMRSVKRQSGRC